MARQSGRLTIEILGNRTRNTAEIGAGRTRQNRHRPRPSYCIVAGHGAGGYAGHVVYSRGKISIVGVYEPGTEGREVTKYILIEPHLRNKVAWFEKFHDFRVAWHQLFNCLCDHNEDMENCPANHQRPYAGPSVSTQEIDSICYIHWSDDSPKDYGESASLSPYWRDVRSYLIHNPDGAKQMADSIRKSGNYEAHRQRFELKCRAYVGKWYDLFGDEGNVIEEVHIADFNSQSDTYLCEVYPATSGNSEPSREVWEEGEAVRLGRAFWSRKIEEPDDECFRLYAL
jgi:hypothetical protein